MMGQENEVIEEKREKETKETDMRKEAMIETKRKRGRGMREGTERIKKCED
jgi:hypothetical protein